MRQANLFMMSAAMLLAACGGTKDAGKNPFFTIFARK